MWELEQRRGRGRDGLDEGLRGAVAGEEGGHQAIGQGDRGKGVVHG